MSERTDLLGRGPAERHYREGSDRLDTENSALVSLVLEDPGRGLAALHDRYARSLNRLVFRLMGPDSEHEDLMQQVFLQIIHSIGKLRSPERLGFWVRSIAVNVVRSELRSRTIRRAFFRKYRVDDHRDLNDEVDSRSFLALSKAVLERMPTDERLVFSLYYLEEASLPEIAEVCGFSTMTAKRRLSRARTRFKKYMNWESATPISFGGGPFRGGKAQ
jgi:RNA polymerase sigma-70 factor (ECF subfamily)